MLFSLRSGECNQHPLYKKEDANKQNYKIASPTGRNPLPRKVILQMKNQRAVSPQCQRIVLMKESHERGILTIKWLSELSRGLWKCTKPERLSRPADPDSQEVSTRIQFFFRAASDSDDPPDRQFIDVGQWFSNCGSQPAPSALEVHIIGPPWRPPESEILGDRAQQATWALGRPLGDSDAGEMWESLF